jgi:cyclopropane fatty-acyl-phospholipid synthase-like methyltransferase
MKLVWAGGEQPAVCPVCTDASAHRLVVGVEDVPNLDGALGFRRCPRCGVVHADRPLTSAGQEEQALSYHLEQGAALDILCEPLLRMSEVRRLLDVGCGFGFALDFARRGLGLEVQGVDPSAVAARGSALLGWPLAAAPLAAGLKLAAPFDGALASEVIEHVAEPRAFLQALRAQLTDDALLRLTTPDAACVIRRRAADAVLAALSPGHHTVLFHRQPLAQLLREAGFAHQRWDSVRGTLRCWASPTRAGLARLRGLPPDGWTRFRTYLGQCADDAEPGSALAVGFAARHFKATLQASRFDDAEASLARLRSALLRRYAIDLTRPDEAVSALRALVARGLDDLEALPCGLSTALFFLGVLELEGRGQPAHASAVFAASASAADLLIAATEGMGVVDGETRDLRSQALRRRAQALARGAGGTSLSAAVRRAPRATARQARALLRRGAQGVYRRLGSLLRDGHGAEGGKP